MDEVIGTKRNISYADLGNLQYLTQVLQNEVKQQSQPFDGTFAMSYTASR